MNKLRPVSPKLSGSTREPFARFGQILELKKGWMDGKGEPFEFTKIALVSKILYTILTQFSLIPPYIYPTIDNEISIEWESETIDLELLFDLQDQKILCVKTNKILQVTTTSSFSYQAVMENQPEVQEFFQQLVILATHPNSQQTRP